MADAAKTRGGFDAVLVVWRRRKWLALSVFAAAVAMAAGVAAHLPDRYRATVTLLIEREDLEDALSRQGMVDEVDARLQAVGQRILSRSRLEELIRRFNLYPDLRARGALTEDLVEQMRRDVRLAPKGADDPGGHGTTIALAQSFSSSNPRVAADVANALAASYVDDDLKNRQKQTGDAVRFLKAQLDSAKRQYDESSAVQARLLDRKRALSRPLGSLEPESGPDSVGARLAKLRLDLTELKTRDKDQHPEVMRVQEEIRALERQLPTAGAVSPQAQRDGAAIAQLEASLAKVDAGLMSSEYESDKDHYLSLVKRYEDARLSESMAQNKRGDQVRILDPAVVPAHPVAPNRMLLVLGGAVLAAGLALGAVALAERLDTSFHTVGDLREFTRVPILASIPRIATGSDTRRRRRKVVLGALAAAGALLLLVEASHYVAGWYGGIILKLMEGRA